MHPFPVLLLSVVALDCRETRRAAHRGDAHRRRLNVLHNLSHVEQRLGSVLRGFDGLGRLSYLGRQRVSLLGGVQMVEGEAASTLSEPLDLYVDPDLWLDPAHLLVRYDLEGTRYVQPYFHYVGDKGCQALRDDNGWQVRPHPGAPLRLEARLACPGGTTPSASLHYLDAATPMSNLTGDLYAATSFRLSNTRMMRRSSPVRRFGAPTAAFSLVTEVAGTRTPYLTLILGSNHPYEISTNRFASTTAMATTRTTPWMYG